MAEGKGAPDSYCCKVKQYMLHDMNFVNTVEIYPRVIICKKRLRKYSCYEQTITVRNTGMYARSFHYSTDSFQDTEIILPPGWQNDYLLPEDTVVIRIIITPRDSINIDRRRHIYIESQHPSITFEIPIIVLTKEGPPSIPNSIDFPRTVPKTKTFYEFVAYNSLPDPQNISVKAVTKNITITMRNAKIPRKDYGRVLLTLYVKDMESYDNIIKVKVGNSQPYPVKVMHEPARFALFMNVSHLHFEELKYERESSQTFAVCNDSQLNVEYSISFLTDKYQLEENYLQTISYPQLSDTSMASEGSVKNASPPAAKIVQFSMSAHKHFSINIKSGEFDANSSKTFTVLFRPVQVPECDFDDDLHPPFTARTKLFLTVKDELAPLIKTLILTGLVSGPEIEIKPTTIDLRKIYMGEEQCEQIKVLNVDGVVDAKVNFSGYHPEDVAGIEMKPADGYLLPSCKSGLFTMSFFSRVIGKFMVKLMFKVRNGGFYEVVVRGTAQQVRVKIFPDLLEFGSVPFAIPQKRHVLLINPLAVPVMVQCTVTEDGEETPLVLDIRDVNEYPPLTMKDHVKIMLMGENDFKIDECQSVQLTSREPSLESFRSIGTSETSYSTRFEEEILDPLKGMASDLVYRIRAKRVLEKRDVEKRVVSEAMDSLLSTDYFKGLLNFSNYSQLDWNTVPSDPKEVYCDCESIYLKPNSGKYITVMLIPNVVGYFNRWLDLRVCPIDLHSVGKPLGWDARAKNLVKSELLVSKLWLEYNCRVPQIEFSDFVSFELNMIYAGQRYEFHMEFTNLSNICGFMYYDVVPKCDEGEMFFVDNTWKYYIPADTNILVPCYVVMRKPGTVKLSGLIKFVGHTVGYPFHITASVKPTRAQISPSDVYHRQNVMEYSRVHIYIENSTPTITWLTIQLKYTRHQFVEPNGAILGPKGQGTYVTIHSKYYDPEIYKNILIIDMKYGECVEIPITYNITGMPVFFEPNIRDDFDCGVFLVNSEENYLANIPRYTTDIKVTNRGERTYRLIINRLKATNTIGCAAYPGRGRIDVTPKVLVLLPNTEQYLQISANACDMLTVYNEFRVEIVDQDNKLRTQNIRFVLTAKFIEPEVVWSTKEIYMKYHRRHVFNENMHIEVVRLKNVADVEIDSVVLKAVGPFKMHELFEHRYTKQLQFAMNGREEKEITVLLNKLAIRDEFCSNIDGRILCTANDKIQRSLLIKLKVRSPELEISQRKLVLFVQSAEGITFIELQNISCLEAQYKWKKSGETIKYVGEYDDVRALSLDILSEIFRMLEISEEEEESEEDSLYQHNMTARYQKYRCRLRKLEDPIGIDTIINEIVDNLDYEHRRYGVKLTEDTPGANFQLERGSSGTYVKKTIDTLLDKLKLEDSYQLSDVSTENCEADKTIYFCEKSGVVRKNEKKRCYIYMPPVKPNYAQTAKFTLDVVGSCPQQFEITLVHLERVIELSRDSIYLGIKPWYELYKTSVKVKNLTSYNTNLRLEVADPNKKRQRVSHGYCKIVSPTKFSLCEYGRKSATFEGVMGFCDVFTERINIIANDSDVRQLSLRGQGIMPILLVTTKLKRPEQDFNEIVEEYTILQRIYYFDMFKGITEVDDELGGIKEEEMKETSSQMTDLSVLTYRSSASSSTARKAEARFFKILKTYVLVNNNEELPNAVVLEQLVVTQKFMMRLAENDDTVALLHLVYRDYVKLLKCYDEKMPINLKHFTAQPLPFHVHGYVLNMNEIKVGRLRKFVVDLQFFGPGKLIAAARTAVKIPGLVVDFDVDKSNDQEFIFYSAEEKAPDLFQKPYRNMYERVIDQEGDPKLKHAHSFDADSLCRHKRVVSARQLKQIHNYYNSLNKSVYMEHKHHYILCKVFSNSKKNFSGTKLRVVLLLKPRGKYYEEGQMIEDYLFIDLHMGPTLPILLRGLITKQ